MNILIPMAGDGSRFKINGFELPKPLISVDGKPMIQRAVETLNLSGHYIYVIRKYTEDKNNDLLHATLKKITPDCDIITIDKLTNGSAETCLEASSFIDNDKELIITNCDQLMEWNSYEFLSTIRNLNIDGAVITYNSKDPKNSFADVNSEGYVTNIVEKEVISDNALIGVHYWKHGHDFVSSTKEMISKNIKHKNEYYVGPTYNELIKKNKKIFSFKLNSNEYIPVGTPEDLNIYIGRKKEYDKNKPKTILCDLDGTIFKHAHKYSNIKNIDNEILTGVRKKFDEWDSLGHKIILMTGRKESARKLTEELLEKYMIPYDILLMGIGNGQRILINDKITSNSFDRAIGVNVITNEGFEKINWDNFDL